MMYLNYRLDFTGLMKISQLVTFLRETRQINAKRVKLTRNASNQRETRQINAERVKSTRNASNQRETRKFNAKCLKFLLFALIFCFSPLFYANAETIITSFTQNGTTAGSCLINGGPETGASISGEIIIADILDIPIDVPPVPLPYAAFRNNISITSVTAAGNITYIRNYAFAGTVCNITFKDVYLIESFAFENSSGNITFNNLDYIPAAVFENASGDITINNVISISGRNGTSGTITINNIGTIRTGAFENSSGAITINNVETIQTGAFENSSGAITFNDVETIQTGAFNGSSGDITFNSVETIEADAFNGSSSKIYVSRKMTEEKMQEFYSIGGYQGTLEIIPRNTTHINKVNIKKGRLIIKPQE
ncbi:MAG: leucine-rich repeat domain-containing protein [Bacteroidetes bacterium]|nr:leucine-rich repeat domain-containing protein [Bacteroidota bacterium]